MDDIVSIEGIRDATPQLYLESLAADCCSAATQLIAFEPETDYIVTPWLEKDNLPAPGKNQMYLGSSITPSEPGKIKFFGVEYEVLGQLERTGTSYDTCAFMTWDTAQEIMGCEKWVQSFGEPKGEAEDLVSSIMIRVEDGTDAKAVARKINFQLDGAPVAAYTTNGIFNGVMESVAGMTGYCTVLMALILVLVATALVTVFTITMNERTEEFGILASLGVSSRRLGGIVPYRGQHHWTCGRTSGSRDFRRLSSDVRSSHPGKAPYPEASYLGAGAGCCCGLLYPAFPGCIPGFLFVFSMEGEPDKSGWTDQGGGIIKCCWKQKI